MHAAYACWPHEIKTIWISLSAGGGGTEAPDPAPGLDPEIGDRMVHDNKSHDLGGQGQRIGAKSFGPQTVRGCVLTPTILIADDHALYGIRLLSSQQVA